MDKITDLERIWLSPAEAALYLGISEQTLALRRTNGQKPKFSKPAGRVYYFKEDLDAYIRGE